MNSLGLTISKTNIMRKETSIHIIYCYFVVVVVVVVVDNWERPKKVLRGNKTYLSFASIRF
jgi:hypothetical protein